MPDPITRLNAALEGRYRIESELGEGGMATVYLADDLKHERKVALKVLKPELAAVVGAERFLAEIKTTANLQHPHILPLFDSGEADTYLFYVMPLVEGESLREKLDREKQLGVEEALDLAKKVADALDYAHENGVVHRDIKPGNILLSARGEPLLADFGIALAVAQAGGGRITETGLSLGTPHYMSPEQATGDRDVDPRSDVYALGCVLFEMLAGEPPFSASTAQAILAKILTMDAPSITMVRRTVPPNVGNALAKALEKLPADRFTSAAAFSAALTDRSFTYEDRARTSVQTSAPETVAASASRSGWSRVGVAVGMVVALGVGVAVGVALQPTPEPGVPTRVAVTGLDLEREGGGWRLAISPDGRWFVAGHREGGPEPALYIREASATEWRLLPNTENGTNPTFSPDGQSVAFNNGGALLKVPINGGPALPIADVPSSPHWGLPDVIVYNTGGVIYRVGASGGEPEVLFESDTISANRPHLLPNGRGVVFGTAAAGDPLNSRIMYLDIGTGEVREIVSSGNQPHYVSTGHLIYGHGSQSLMGVPFDAEAGERTGDPITLLTSLTVYSGGASQFAVSESGTLIYDAAGDAAVAGARSLLVEVDLEGVETPLAISPAIFDNPRYSPDGSQVAYDDDEGVRIYSFANNTTPVLASEGANRPVWSASGEYVYFRLGRQGIGDVYRRRADFSEEAELIADRSNSLQVADVSADDSIAVVNEFDGPSNADILLMRQGASGVEFEDFLTSEWMERDPAISPDGRWIAYSSNQSGEARIYVQSFPVATGQRDVSPGLGILPKWHPDGPTLFYKSGSQAMAVDFTTEPTFSATSVPRMLFENPQYEDWDIHPDGSRFVVVAGQGAEEGPVGDDALAEIYIVTNWFEELRDRMGEN